MAWAGHQRCVLEPVKEMLVTIGMLTVRIFGQFSFDFPIQFLIENESKIGLFMKMGPYGPFS